jgi:phage shock protein PspC (stress-responsive transcriptional regulator)
MYCTQCGSQQEDSAKYCSQCGKAANAPPPADYVPPAQSGTGYGYRRLVRPRQGRLISGVCAGLGRYWGLDPVLVRILFVGLALCPVLPAIVPYLVCWIIIPSEEPVPLALPAASQQSA